MIVDFRKINCPNCARIRYHEIIHIPCCVVCGEYNMGEVIKPEPLEIEHFSR